MLHHKFAPSNCMIPNKYLNAKRIKDLEAILNKKCVKENLSEIGGFIIMFDEESGQEIRFVKDMPVDVKDDIEKYQNINNSLNNTTHGNISHNYTGFVQGNMAGWILISEVRIVEQLNFYNYEVNKFINYFKSLNQN